MKITPLEIRQKTFEKVFRGYDKDEVSAYLVSLSQEWERTVEENKEMGVRIESLEREVSKLREVESSLFKTLKTAEDTGANLIEQAKKETELKIKESHMKSEEIVIEARAKAKKLLENAESKTKKILDEMIAKVKLIENDYNRIQDLRDKLISQMKNYSLELDERIDKFEKKSGEMAVDDIVSEAKDAYNSALVDVESILQKAIEVSESPEPAPDHPADTNETEAGSGKPDNTDVKDENPEDEVQKLEKEEKSAGNRSSQSFFDEIE